MGLFGDLFNPVGYATGQLFGSGAKDSYNSVMDPLHLSSSAPTAAPPSFASNPSVKPGDIQFRSALVGAPTQSQLQANSGNDMQAFGSPSTPGAMASAQSNPLGSLAQGYQLNTMVAPKANTSGLDAERGLAGNGPDGFLSKQLASNQMNTSGQLDNNAKANQNSYFNTLSNMAQNGGASGAARERAITASDRNAFSSDQNIAQAGAMKGLDIQGAGLQKQFDMNNTIQNQDNQQYNAGVQQAQNQQDVQKYNIGNTLGEIQSQRGFDQNKYNTDMSAWAGGKAADAQRAGVPAAKSGGLLGSVFGNLFG